MLFVPTTLAVPPLSFSLRYNIATSLHTSSASCGFSFSLQDDFDTRFKHLLEFKKEFGHTKVPVFYTGHNNLGRWAKRMRDGIRNNDPWVSYFFYAFLFHLSASNPIHQIIMHRRWTTCAGPGCWASILISR
jgi:hypothetical protein